MTSRMYFVFFVVAPLFVTAAVEKIDSDTLLNVFGDARQYDAALAASNIQAETVVPHNVTLEDPDYWDSTDDFTPAKIDYDSFDWTLTSRVAASSDENFLLSPVGLKMALGILTEAATGATQNELSSVLGFAFDRNLVRNKFQSIIESLKKKSSDHILNLGSRIYVGDSAQPRQRFAAIAKEFYKTELRTINFFDPVSAAKEINGWVSNITEGRIPDLVNSDDVANLVVMILNTLYFKGSWRHQFQPKATKDGPFYLSAEKQSTAPFMHVKDNFYYTESTKYDAKILRMPYRGNKFAMYIVVPNSIAGLPLVLSGLSDLRTEMDNMSEKLVDVTLPRFKFEYTSHLSGILQDLGVRTAFGDEASFPGIARGQLLHQRLRISKVLQRSGIEVNELGSIAYTATEISLVNKFGEDTENYYEVVADKPFLFFIQDEATRQLLFTGRVSNPALVDGAYKLH